MTLLKHELLPLDVIRTDGGTQTRAAIDEATAQEYAEALLAGEELPSADVFFDGVHYWLAAGFHRRRSHEIAQRPEMWCKVHEGTQRDAVLFGIQDNTRHGLRPSPEDRARAAAILLTDPEWSQWTDSQIARVVCGCESGSFRNRVAEMREKLAGLAGRMRKVTRGGTNYEMNTDGMKAPGKKREARPPQETGPWIQAALEDIERAREALTHVDAEPAEQGVLALDLAHTLVCGLLKPTGTN